MSEYLGQLTPEQFQHVVDLARDADDSVPAVYVGGYRHQATIPCRSCQGEGNLGLVPSVGAAAVCVACNGTGRQAVGCGGPVERDNHYRVTYCSSCRRYVPPEEVSQE